MILLPFGVLIICAVLAIGLCFLITACLRVCSSKPEMDPQISSNPNQTADIWNISGRVNHQDGPVTSEPSRWPTHDHHVSIDSFVINENLQAHKKPPPPYCEVDLPSYEQATGLAPPKNDVPAVHTTPSSSRTVDGQTS